MKSRTKNRTIAATLWTAQALLAGLFIFAGAVKLSIPTETLAAQTVFTTPAGEDRGYFL